MIVEYEFKKLGHGNYYRTVKDNVYVPQVGHKVTINENHKVVIGTVKELTYHPDLDVLVVLVK